MLKRNIFIVFGIIAVMTIPTFAQSPASGLQDLVGARASSGEGQLRGRGYVFVKSTDGSDRKWSNWWSRRSNQCITVTTVNGRYDSIVTSPAFDCNRGGNSGGPSYGNGNQTNPPSWARGTFYGTGPGGERIALTIADDGAVTANVGGNTNYGSFTRGNYLNIGGASARVTRQGNGIVTTRSDNGERIVYSRNEWSGPSNGGNWDSAPAINPPSWARGTFYGTGPMGQRIVLTINDYGSASASINGNMSYGSFTRGNRLHMGDATASVSRQGSGIVTTRTDNGERIVYSRNPWGDYWGGGNRMNLSDLAGSRASSGESQLRSRGFRNVDSFRSGNTSYTIWWNQQSGQCVQTATANGRYDSIVDIGTHPKCN